jgi:hypothetical protein
MEKPDRVVIKAKLAAAMVVFTSEGSLGIGGWEFRVSSGSIDTYAARTILDAVVDRLV